MLSALAEQLSEQPRRLNQLSYNKPVFEETGRMLPGAASIRQAYPGEDLVAKDETRSPMDDRVIMLLHPAEGHLPNHWPNPMRSLPTVELPLSHEFCPMQDA